MIIALCIFAIGIALRVFQNTSIYLANKFISLVSFLTSPIMKIVIAIIFGILVWLSWQFSGEIDKFLEVYRKAKKEADNIKKAEGAVGKAEAAAKSVSVFTEELNKGSAK